jgi:hypothetical protein
MHQVTGRASRRAKVKLAIDTKETVQIQRHIAYLIRYDVISTVNDRLPALSSLRMIAHVSFVYMIPTLRGLSDRILSQMLIMFTRNFIFVSQLLST